MRAMLLEARLFLATLTLRKLWNYLLVYCSYAVARATSRPVHWGQPITLGIEPTTACNLRCPQCPSGLRAFTRPTGRLQPGVFHQLIDETKGQLMRLVLYFQGEPYLNPHFTELVKYATDRGIYVGSSTNAHFLDHDRARATVESGLQHLIVSVDGTTQESYARYRKEGDLETVLAGIRTLVKWKRELRLSTPLIDLQFIVFKHNEHEIPAIKKLGKELGVDRVSIKTAQVYDTDAEGAELIPVGGQYSRYERTETGEVKIKNKLLDHCWKLWQGAEITWDGRVLPCCFDKDARYEMGRFPERSFRNIWHSEAYRSFRARLTRSRAEIDICQNCTEGTRVWA